MIIQQAWSGKIEKEVDYKNKYEYDSILQFSRACINEEPKITSDNVFGYSALCDEWQSDEGIKKYADDYIQENAQELLIKHILFQLSHEQDPSSEKNNLRENLPKYIDDPCLTQLPFEVLNEVVDFKVVEDDQESFQKVYSFCLQYLDEHQDIPNRSELFSTLNTSKISYEDLSRLTCNSNFDRTKLNDSLGAILGKIIERTDVMPKTVEEIQEKYHNDLEEMKEREEAYKADQDESKKLREELKDQKEKVDLLIKQVDELRSLKFDSITSFMKEINQLREDMIKAQAEREKREKEEKIKREKEEKERIKREKEELKAKVPVYYPDWSNCSNVGWSNNNAQGDGWMVVQVGCSNYSSPANVTVAGKKKFIICGSNASYTYSSVCFPIRSGQNLTYYSNSCTSTYSYFIKPKNNKAVLLPDWDNATLKLWCQKYTADCDGWLYADTGSNGNQGYLQMNDNISIYICQQNNGYQAYSSVFVPVSKDDKYYFYHGSYPGVCYFIPGRKDNETGMPDWNQEKGQSWDQKYEASEKGWVYAQCQCYYCSNASSSNSPGFLMVNGIPILISQMNYSGGYYENGSVFIPVAKGDTYNAIGGYANQSISFFPCLK